MHMREQNQFVRDCRNRQVKLPSVDSIFRMLFFCIEAVGFRDPI